jgi:hypothetical protein
VNADLAVFGLPPLPDQDPEVFAVWPDNWTAVELFCSLATQWRVGAMGGFLGLDYPAVESVMRIRRLPERAELFGAVQIMERAALPLLNQK